MDGDRERGGHSKINDGLRGKANSIIKNDLKKRFFYYTAGNSTTSHNAISNVSHNMITYRKISAVEAMAVAAAEALKQEKVLAKSMKKGGKPSYPGAMNMKDMKEGKDKHELKAVKISDSDELHHVMDGKGAVSVPGSVPVHDPVAVAGNC